MTPSDTAAASAYDHCARLLEGRAAISPNVDGEHTEAVAQAFERVANTMRECSQADCDADNAEPSGGEPNDADQVHFCTIF